MAECKMISVIFLGVRMNTTVSITTAGEPEIIHVVPS